MLTAHELIAIRTRLPEVAEIDSGGHILIVRLRLEDGTDIVIHCHGRRCRRCRLISDDYIDKLELIAIDQDMRDRLVSVFGQLSFDN